MNPSPDNSAIPDSRQQQSLLSRGVARSAGVCGLIQNRKAYIAICWLLGGLFIYAGVIKISDPQSFADNIAAYQLLPAMLINPIALGLPIFEILAGVLLITGWQRRLATLSLLLLTIVFAIFIASAIARGLRIDCGCFGSSIIPLRYQLWFALVRDLILLAVVGYVYRTTSRVADSKDEL